MKSVSELLKMAHSVGSREDLEALVVQLRRRGILEGSLVTRFCCHGCLWCDGRHATGKYTWDEVLDWVRYTPGVLEALLEERRNPKGLPYLRIPGLKQGALQDQNIIANKPNRGYSLGFGFTEIIAAIEGMALPEKDDD